MKPLTLTIIAGAALAVGAVFAVGALNGVTPASATSDETAVATTRATQDPQTQKTVTLKVDNMYCPSCPYIVRQALMRTPGVIAATVSLRDKQAVVTFDSTKTDVAALIAATTEAGYPSRLADN